MELTNYEDTENSQINRLETYIFFRDDEAGFLVESSSWRWPETHQVTTEGFFSQFDTLWELPAEKMNYWGIDSVYIHYGSDFASTMPHSAPFPSINGIAYDIYAEGALLKANTLKWNDLEQEIGRILYDFGSEKILRIDYDDKKLTVLTDTAAYFFDDNFHLQISKQWPNAVTTKNIGEDLWDDYAVVSDDLGMVAYVGDGGVYLCEMAELAVPTLVQKSVPFNVDTGDAEGPYPLCFLPDNRLLLGVGMWERTGAFRMIDYQGQIIHAVSAHISGHHSGGNCIIGETGAVFCNAIEDHKYMYFSFSDGSLAPCGWLSTGDDTFLKDCIPDSDNPNIWYMTYHGGDSRVFQADFSNNTLTPLPVTIEGADSALLSVGQNGELLMCYAYKSEQGFCVYRPNNDVK